MEGTRSAMRQLCMATLVVGGCSLFDSEHHLVGGDAPHDGGRGGAEDVTGGGRAAGGRGTGGSRVAGEAGAAGDDATGASGTANSGASGDGTTAVGGTSHGGSGTGAHSAGENAGGSVDGGEGGAAADGGAAPLLPDCFDTGTCVTRPKARLVASGDSTCFVDGNGQVRCWGNGIAPVLPSEPVTEIAGGYGYFYFLGASGTVTSSSGNVLGTGFDRVSAWTSIVAALHPDGTVVAFNDSGVGGAGWIWEGPIDPSMRLQTVAASAGGICGLHGTGAATCWPRSRVSLSAGLHHTCLAAMDGTLRCWGDDSQGQASPPSGGNFIQVSVGAEHGCAVKPSGDIWCWGANAHGESSPPPGAYSHLAAGKGFTCAVHEGLHPFCWGDVPFPETALPYYYDAPSAFITAGDAHACWTSRPVQCWGDDSKGQASAPPNTGMYAISAGGDHSCGIVEYDEGGVHQRGDIECWGDDAYGQSSPPAGTFIDVASGAEHTCAITTTGTVRCWGRNDRGQAKAPSGQFVAISAGGAHTCAVSVSGYTMCWGDAAFGQLKAPLPPTFLELALGGGGGGLFESILCGTRTDGTRFCNNAPPGYSLPEPDLHDFALTGVDDAGPACALRADQSAVCWGVVGSADILSPPPGAFDSITLGFSHACGLRPGGTIACWGSNIHQQLDVPVELREP